MKPRDSFSPAPSAHHRCLDGGDTARLLIAGTAAAQDAGVLEKGVVLP